MKSEKYVDGQSAGANDQGYTQADEEALKRIMNKNEPVITDAERKKLVLDAQKLEEEMRGIGIEPEDE